MAFVRFPEYRIRVQICINGVLFSVTAESASNTENEKNVITTASARINICLNTLPTEYAFSLPALLRLKIVFKVNSLPFRFAVLLVKVVRTPCVSLPSRTLS